MLLGFIPMVLGQCMAIANLVRYREFPNVGPGGGIVWVLSFLITPPGLYGAYNGAMGAIRQQQNRAVAQAVAVQQPNFPGAPPAGAFDGQPGVPPNIPNPNADDGAGAGGPPVDFFRNPVEVSLSSGDFSERTDPVGPSVSGWFSSSSRRGGVPSSQPCTFEVQGRWVPRALSGRSTTARSRPGWRSRPSEVKTARRSRTRSRSTGSRFNPET